ncbi:hypothetical protein [Pseudomonas sp. NPDC007930]|uniref:hypothetical protein n=1 Tax=Pseudomonas sp. NPDC007930 TaxID=3364417 RepID=UPI0036E9614E
MMITPFKWARRAGVSCVVLCLAGCAAMDAGMTQLVEANQTPENMGISTASYRGMDCASLKMYADGLRADQPRQTPAIAKSFGWRIDAMEQVRREQGCDRPGNGAAPAYVLPAMYGICWQLSGRGDSYLSSIFQYSAWGTERDAPEKAQFSAFLKRTYGIAAPQVSCEVEDSLAKAQARREHVRSIGQFNLSIKTIEVAWAPTPVAAGAARVAPAVVAPAQGTTAPTQNTAPADAGVLDVPALGASFSDLAPSTAKVLGLPTAQRGVMVVRSLATNGLKPLDVIVEIAGRPVASASELKNTAERMRAGYTATVRLWREHAFRDLPLTVAAPSAPSP